MNERISGLEIDADRRFQERCWIAERFGWAAMGLLILAALAGFTGTSGPASSGRVIVGDAVIDYPRIARWQTADKMSVEFRGDGMGRVLLPAEFADAFAIEGVTPQPARVVATSQGPMFEFDLANEGGARTIKFAVRADRPSLPQRARGEVDGRPFDFTFMVLP